MNEFLFFLTIALAFMGIIVLYRFLGKVGVFSWIAFASIVANIEVLKCVDIFGLSLTLGNVLYGTNFLATDILSEFYGGKESRKAVKLGFIVLIAWTLLSQVSMMFIPNAEDWASPAMKTIFEFAPRICLASLTAYFISNTLDTYIYDWIGKHTKHIWMKNNGSTLTSQLLDSFLFTIMAFVGTMPFGAVIELSLTTYAVKVLISLLDTPMMYLAKGIYEKNFKGKTIEK